MDGDDALHHPPYCLLPLCGIVDCAGNVDIRHVVDAGIQRGIEENPLVIKDSLHPRSASPTPAPMQRLSPHLGINSVFSRLAVLPLGRFGLGPYPASPSATPIQRLFQTGQSVWGQQDGVKVAF